MSESIVLIGLPPPAAVSEGDRQRGEPHGGVAMALGKVAHSIPMETFSGNFVAIIDRVKSIAENLKAGVGDYTADEITIGLAITAEGSIGIATTGVEASIEVRLRLRP